MCGTESQSNPTPTACPLASIYSLHAAAIIKPVSPGRSCVRSGRGRTPQHRPGPQRSRTRQPPGSLHAARRCSAHLHPQVTSHTPPDSCWLASCPHFEDVEPRVGEML